MSTRHDAVEDVGRAGLETWLDKASNEPRAALRIVCESLLTVYQIRQRRGKADEEPPQ